MTLPNVLKPEEAAKVLRCSARTVRTLCETGQLRPVRKVGRGSLQNAAAPVVGMFPAGEGRSFGAYLVGRNRNGVLCVARDADWCVALNPRELATVADAIDMAERIAAGTSA